MFFAIIFDINSNPIFKTLLNFSASHTMLFLQLFSQNR